MQVLETILIFASELFEAMVNQSRAKKFARFQVITYSTFAVS